jgi:hypothetical protein
VHDVHALRLHELLRGGESPLGSELARRDRGAFRGGRRDADQPSPREARRPGVDRSDEPNAGDRDTKLLSHDPRLVSHDPKLLSHSTKLLSHSTKLLSHGGRS